MQNLLADPAVLVEVAGEELRARVLDDGGVEERGLRRAVVKASLGFGPGQPQ